MYSKTCADFNKALVGIHPQFKHTPPRDTYSTIAVFKPNCEARIAVTYPPGPLPITMTSKFIFSLCFKS